MSHYGDEAAKVPRESHSFVARLEQSIAGRNRIAIDEPAARRAAVAIVATRDADPALLFIKRQVREGDPWSGHVAFPGGFRAGPGESPTDTARRETLEETGLDLAAAGIAIGLLDDVYPRSVRLPKVVVTPSLFTVERRIALSAGPEVDQVVWLPVSGVFAEENRQPYTLKLPTGERVFDSIHLGGLIIWGLTERILQQVATLAFT